VNLLVVLMQVRASPRLHVGGALTQVDREQVDEVLHAFDKDVSKSIDYDEFQQVVSRCLVSHGRFT